MVHLNANYPNPAWTQVRRAASGVWPGRQL